ncbi:hypothetical protein BDZ94DRAFT_408386 [Collybia nuda]|uniref:Uncharacterized protein n=1 Tax=Collybia nuda TaxID=64659 RepID=A0A9P5YB25_9AGAR|nr:hypothetical protein BDZ94DRAFT_408386 [Collybia nuda]
MKHRLILVWLSSIAFLITSALLLYTFQLRDTGTLVVPGQIRHFTYIGEDHPREWDIPALEKVHMSVENTLHYRYDNGTEWDRLLPSNGVLHLGDHHEEFTVSMFHQLRCLNIVRGSLVSHRSQSIKDSEMKLARHCMNYLRQMVLCRSQLHLESVRDHVGVRLTVSETTHTCRDWTAVYEAAEANVREYKRKKGLL